MKSRYHAVAVCLATATLRAGTVHAEAAGDAERARALFKDARALTAAGHYDEACPKFAESLKLDVGIGTKFNLADCLEHTGHPLGAQTLFLEVADTTHESGQKEREAAARARAEALDAAIPELVIDVKVAAPKLEIRRDDVIVEPKFWGAPRPVDPGKHTIKASAPGRKPWSAEVEIPPRTTPATPAASTTTEATAPSTPSTATATPPSAMTSPAASSPVVVAVPELESLEAPKLVPVPVVVPAKDEGPAPRKTEKPEEPPPPRTEDNTVPIILYSGVGAGVLLTATSLVFYKLSNDKAESICPSGVNCSPSDVQSHDGFVSDARTSRGLAYLGLGVTGASLAAAAFVTMMHTHRKEAPPSGCVTAAPLVSRDGFGAAMQATF